MAVLVCATDIGLASTSVIRLNVSCEFRDLQTVPRDGDGS